MADSDHPPGNAGRLTGSYPQRCGRPLGTGNSAIQANGGPRPGNAEHQFGENRSAISLKGDPGDPRWHSRGYLPHFDSPGAVQHITYHLADSVSQEALQRLHSEIVFLPESERDAERRKRLEAWIDSGHGSCVLRDPVAAEIVQTSFLNFDAERYRLLD